MNAYEKIKLFRKQKNLSQAQISESTGISQAAYAKIESGETKSITIEVGKGIAKALGIPFAELFDIEASKDNSELIEKLKGEKENLKEEIKEKQYLIDLLKDEKAHLKLYLLMRLFGRYENAIRAIDAEISESQNEVDKINLEKRKQFVDSEFTLDKNAYINQRIITQIEFDEFRKEMINVYNYLPSELGKQK